MFFTRVRSPSEGAHKGTGKRIPKDKKRHLHAKKAVLELVERLERNDPAMREIRLCGAKLGDLDAVTIAKSLRHNTIVTRVRLARNRIGDRGAKAFAWLLRHNTTITVLNLRSNRICDAGAHALSATLKRNSTVKDLGLDCNYTSDGLRHEVDALSHVPGLKRTANWADRLKQEEEDQRHAETCAMSNADAEGGGVNSVWRAAERAVMKAEAERTRIGIARAAQAAEKRALRKAKEKETRLMWEQAERERREKAELLLSEAADRARADAKQAYFGVLNLEPASSR
jgi:hypothetical protein